MARIPFHRMQHFVSGTGQAMPRRFIFRQRVERSIPSVAAAAPLFHRCSSSARSRRSLSPVGASFADRGGASSRIARRTAGGAAGGTKVGRGHAPAPRPRCPPSRAPHPGNRRPHAPARSPAPARFRATGTPSGGASPRGRRRAPGRAPASERLQDVIDQQGDVLPALAQRRDDEGDDVQPVEEILPESARRASLPSAPGSWRRSRGRPPAGSCCFRRARTRGPGGHEAASPGGPGRSRRSRRGRSSRRRPPRTVPILSATAPVKAPFTWPNSSDSRQRFREGRRVHLDERFLPRGDSSWIARANSPFPVPLSPVISTVESVSFTISTRSKIRRIRGVFPTMSRNGNFDFLSSAIRSISSKLRKEMTKPWTSPDSLAKNAQLADTGTMRPSARTRVPSTSTRGFPPRRAPPSGSRAARGRRRRGAPRGNPFPAPPPRGSRPAAKAARLKCGDPVVAADGDDRIAQAVQDRREHPLPFERASGGAPCNRSSLPMPPSVSEDLDTRGAHD